ncbi:Prepilin-type N-terminal cleavage/methylation domain-containing protein [Sulfidibacter corallicola]|uniref:Prepilin-type N-terminal cleavage/methylation domain-containing protein n=1 Tax=Sulfidibacter corallicola TaxID=2818388 RepID=A0A8A4TYH7_SULCO|nr:prepilin-type N-terminal cleavage/methylation domain-containing protein [Sulfidibacter corallicola]QTD54144.1 prepilin-type N-terminal cleavage/methylation domain-containing protein [Sulfidibacter corallicola]
MQFHAYRKPVRSGFSLLELMVVLTILGLLAGIATSTHRNTAQKSRETVLRHNLAQIRMTLDEYNHDKGHYPEGLETLVDEGYLREIPRDPLTNSSETWTLIYESDFADEDSSYEPGLFDIKSGSPDRALDGTFYSEW